LPGRLGRPTTLRLTDAGVTAVLKGDEAAE
jgi:hypothetical protein